jgi:hydroxymethylpyrimidine pyrophosphatase-like HAD family hydrolase
VIIVVDLDGTVADNSHREGFIQGNQKDWDAFYRPELIAKDKLIMGAREGLVKLTHNRNHKVIFLTGRPERTRRVTEDWIETYIWPVFAGELIMRGDTDRRKAHDYKRSKVTELYSLHRAFHNFLFIDDDPQTYEMFWQYGVVLQAPECWAVLP